MSTDKIIPVLLAGGAGSRLWPTSRDDLPKQFQPLAGEYSTYQETLLRVGNPALFSSPLVITNDAFRFFAMRQARSVGHPATVVLEPARRDSAAAMAVAAVMAERKESGSLVLALAADHFILDNALFEDAIKLGSKAARQGKIVVFGLQPTEPRTSYGYIHPGRKMGGHEDLAEVEAFVEKPDAATALEYMKKGYLWNSGNFLFRSDAMIAAFRAFAPDILDAVEEAAEKAGEDLGFVRLHKESFEKAPKNSVDYAVIEKADNIAVVTGRFRWSDIGSWDAILEILPPDENENAVLGNAMVEGTTGSLVHSHGTFTAAVGLKDMIVVSTRDAVLVVPKSKVQDVKKLVERMKSEGIPQADKHRLNHRPWGTVDNLIEGNRFTVKHLVVDCGGVLSLQRHMHRSEHWVVVQGTATITTGETTKLVTENESVYVPVGTVHRIANEGKVPLELIEVCTGSYIGEDDIERMDDIYARK